jgi:NAD(P)-dependent dehydrogenase (short-subunit alcohol dehydrogenase family)
VEVKAGAGIEQEVSLAGRNVLLTGASRGIGRAAAILLSRAGARVAIHYHENEGAASETLEACKSALLERQRERSAAVGASDIGRAAPSDVGPQMFAADLAQPEEVRLLVKRVLEKFGAIHVLVNNAGISHDNPFDEPDWNLWLEKWRRMIDTNLMSCAHAIWCVLPEMKRRGEGRIINVASRAAFRGELGAPDYGAAKAAMVNLTRSLARAMGPHGIVASCIAPGWVETDMARMHLDDDPAKREAVLREIPLGRLATPEDVAGAILYLASPLGAYLNGVCIPVNGGSYLH